MANCEQEQLGVIASIITLLGDEQVQDTLKDEDHYRDALHKLNLPDKAWTPLLQLLNRVEYLQSKERDPDQSIPVNHLNGEEIVLADDQSKRTLIAKQQFEVFGHIRAAFWISMSMSIALFLVGLVLTGFALYEAMQGTSVTLSTLAIGGLGLADFALLFFRRPWQEVSVNLSNSQKVRTISTSYLAGIALVRRHDKQGLAMLEELTNRTVLLLKQSEERDRTKEK